MTSTAALVTGAVLGVLVGAIVGVVGYAILRRRRGVTRVEDVLRGAGLHHLTGGTDAASVVGRLSRELARLTEAEHQARATLTDVLGVLPAAILVFDASGSVLVANTAGDHLLSGRHGDAIVAQGVRELLEGGGDRRVDLVGPPQRSFEIAVRHVADRLRIAVVDDVSERRRLEGMRRDFVANISHELRTPVGAMAVLTEALVEESDPEVVARVAGKVHREAMRVSDAIDDLIELSRIEHDAVPELEQVSVLDLVREAVVRVFQAAEERRIAIRCVVRNESLAVPADRRQVVSALVNLLDNAVKYSETGSEVRITAQACVLDSGVHGVCFEIADQGVGIPARDIERVFERFYRVDRARSRATGGIGLGLAIVRHVAHNHGGEVGVSSCEGVGSTFTLRIPAAAMGPSPSEELP